MMKQRLVWFGITVAAMVIAASIFLLDRSAPSPDEGAFPPAQQSEAGRATPDAPASPPDWSAASATEAEMVIRSTETTGDMTRSRLRGGDLGYVDASSIINRNDPYSIIAFLQAHSELTGADESLEIEIRHISEYPASNRALFNQVIDGKRSPQGKGSVSFDPVTGAVISALASLIAPGPALAGSVVIFQEEAVAIAREAVASAVLEEEAVAIVRDGDTLYVQPRLRPGFAFQISRATPKEIRYALDPETNKTRAEWPVWISARGVAGGLSWEVLVDASTGEIAGINDLVQRYAGGCSDLTFRVCDGSLMKDAEDPCGSTPIHRAKTLQDSHPDAAIAIGYAKGLTAAIKVANPKYIGAARGSDCEVEIVVNVPEDLMGNDAGQYDPNQDRILLKEDEIDTQANRVTIHATEDVVVHEVMHALSKTPSGGVEHGLVTAAESLHVGYGWEYGSSDFTTKPASMSSDMHAGVAHAIYSISISREVGDDMAFKIVLETDLEEPDSGNVYQVISKVAHDLGVGTKVDEILADLGVGPLALSRAKAEYRQKLKEAMAQLTKEERAEINDQYERAAKRIRQAISKAQADWTWEWIREVIERIIERRNHDDVTNREAEQ